MPSRVFGWPRTISLPFAIPSSRPLRAWSRAPHHEQLGPVVDRGEDLDGVLEQHRDRARPLAEELLVGAVATVGSRIRKPREPDEKTGLKQTARSG